METIMVLPHYFVESQIQLRAHQIWQEEGKIDGKAHEHWIRAEAEVIEKIKKGELEIPFDEKND